MSRVIETKSYIRIRTFVGIFLMIVGVLILLVFSKALYEAISIWELFSFMDSEYRGLPIILTGIASAIIMLYAGWRVLHRIPGDTILD